MGHLRMVQRRSPCTAGKGRAISPAPYRRPALFRMEENIGFEYNLPAVFPGLWFSTNDIGNPHNINRFFRAQALHNKEFDLSPERGGV